MARITLRAEPRRVIVAFEADVIADTTDAVCLDEAGYPPAFYLPSDAITPDRLVASDRTSRCPFKGEADYFHWRTAEGALIENAFWRYAAPLDAVAAIAGRLAPDRSKLTVRVAEA
ncbi:MAG: DUF427 domain-containing protein [Maricaulaceae bacterium]